VEARRAAAGTDAQGRAVFVVVEAVRRLDVSRSLVSSAPFQPRNPSKTGRPRLGRARRHETDG
jgi:hypothetical protein